MLRGGKDGLPLSVLDDQLLLLGIHRDFQGTVGYRFVFHIEPIRQAVLNISFRILDAHGVVSYLLY